MKLMALFDHNDIQNIMKMYVEAKYGAVETIELKVVFDNKLEQRVECEVELKDKEKG